MPRHHRIGTSLVAVALVVALAGCGDDDDSTSPDDVSDVVEDATGGDEAAEDGADPGGEDPIGSVEIPDTIPLPDGHEIVQAIGNPDTGYTVILTSPLTVDEAVEFYEAELPAAGWSSASSRDMGGGVMMVEADRADDDHSFAVQISEEGDGTSLQIFTGPPG